MEALKGGVAPKGGRSPKGGARRAGPQGGESSFRYRRANRS